MRERVYEEIQAVSGQSGGASLTADVQRYESLTVSLRAEGAAATALTVAPVPSATSYAPLVLPGVDQEVHYGLGPGCDIGAPVPTALFVSLTVPGGRAHIRVAGARYREVGDARGSTLADMRDRVDRILSKLTLIADLLTRGRR